MWRADGRMSLLARTADCRWQIWIMYLQDPTFGLSHVDGPAEKGTVKVALRHLPRRILHERCRFFSRARCYTRKRVISKHAIKSGIPSSRKIYTPKDKEEAGEPIYPLLFDLSSGQESTHRNFPRFS